MSLPTFAVAVLVGCLGSGVLRDQPLPKPVGPCPEGLVYCPINTGVRPPDGTKMMHCVKPCQPGQYGPNIGNCNARTGCAVLYVPSAPPPPHGPR
ncbi:MAG: hypothetical protein K1X89_29500 [Myxococcaceae bacterium]|nr:hypothetical protein [Myxococcaceae bacterium]